MRISGSGGGRRRRWPASARRDQPQAVPAAGLSNDREIALGGPLPGHRRGCRHRRARASPARRASSVSSAAIAVADRRGIAERHQDAAPIGQQLARMPVGRRDDRLAEPEAVGQRARRHLRLVEIGRDVDVAHRDEVEQRRLVDELVEKHDVVLDAERADARHRGSRDRPRPGRARDWDGSRRARHRRRRGGSRGSPAWRRS